MRAFIILGFLLAATNAASLGYNYGPGISSSIDTSPSNVVQTVGRPVSGGGLIGGGGIGGVSYQTGGGSSYNTGGYSGSSGLVGGGGLSGGGSRLIGGGSGLIGGGSGLIAGGSGLVGGGGGLVGTGSHLSGVSSFGGGSLGGGSLVGGSIGGGSLGGGSAGGGRIGLSLNALDSVPQTVEYSKQFFYFSAPEEHHDEGAVRQQLSNVLKKNLQVVFIKAPENNAATNAALQLAKQAIEQRTAIYVLTKENDGSQLVGQLQQIQESVPTTPEVRFIKYRTPQDIEHARSVIQSQYDNFGGPSQVIDGGVAPVLNYASSSGGGSVSGGGLGGGLGVGGGSLGGGISYGGGSLGGGLGGGRLGGVSLGGGSYGGGSLGGGSLSGTGSLIGTGGSYGSGGSLGGGGTTFLTGASNTNANYLPPIPLKK